MQIPQIPQMTKNEFRLIRRAGRVWFRGDWSRPVDPLARVIRARCARDFARGVYHEGFTAADSLRQRRACGTWPRPKR